MRSKQESKPDMKVNPLVQLKDLLELGTVHIQQLYRGGYEVTVFVPGNHTHFEGDTLAEDINRAAKAGTKQ